MDINVRKTEYIALISSITIIFIFHVITIREGHIWGGDFALYIQHALNIINDLPYTNTGYIVNPVIPSVSPEAYPPVFPYIIAPLIKIFGLNIYALKISLIVILCISLVLFHKLIIPKINNSSLRILTIILTGLSPWYWDYKDHVLSEFPFILFFITFLIFTEKYLKRDTSSINTEILYGIAIGLTAYLTYGCRSIGLILIPVFIASYLIYKRRFSLALILSSIIFIIGYGVQNEILNTDASYANIATSGEYDIEGEVDNSFFKNGTVLRFLVDNSRTYFFVIERYWDNSFSITIRIITVILTTFFLLIGLWNLIKIRNTSELMVLAYTGLLLVVPFNQGSRYLLPIVPFYFLYILKGIELYYNYSSKKKYILPVITLSLMSLSYLGNYTQMNYLAYQDHVEGKQAKLLYQHIKKNLKKTDVIAFRKPRILALYTGNRSFSYDPPAKPDTLWKNFKEMKADYLLTINTIEKEHSSNMKKLIAQHASKLNHVYSNKQFVLYKIISY